MPINIISFFHFLISINYSSIHVKLYLHLQILPLKNYNGFRTSNIVYNCEYYICKIEIYHSYTCCVDSFNGDHYKCDTLHTVLIYLVILQEILGDVSFSANLYRVKKLYNTVHEILERKNVYPLLICNVI